MKKIILCIAVFTFLVYACKKTANDPSQVQWTTFPTINLSTNFTGYYSIPINGQLPTATMIGTAYDTALKASCAITVQDTNVHVSVPGLYTGAVFATNQFGFVTYLPSNFNPYAFPPPSIFIAITNLPSNPPNLAGVWRMGTTDSLNDTITVVTNGIYSCNNFAGVNLIANPGTGTINNFAIINDSTIAFTDANYGLTGTLSLVPGDTTISYGGMTFTKH